MRAPGLKVIIIPILVFAALPVGARHPNFIDGVRVTDVNALTSPGLLYEEEQWQPGTVTNSRGMYPIEWGGEYIGECGSQAGTHFVARGAAEPSRQGSWRHRAAPSKEKPVVLDFDLGAVYTMQSMVIWNCGHHQSSSPSGIWFAEAVRDVTVYYRERADADWQEYGDFIFAPPGALQGPREWLGVGPNHNPWGTYQPSNALDVDRLANPTETPVSSGPIFDHYFYEPNAELLSDGSLHPESLRLVTAPTGEQPLTARNLRPIALDDMGAARYIRFQITANWGSADEVALSEVRFYKDGPGLYVDVDPFHEPSWDYVDPENHVDFGDAYRGWTKPHEIRVYNLAPSETSIIGVSADGPFGVLVDAQPPIPLAPARGIGYEHRSIHALFDPEELGKATGAIDIEYAWRGEHLHQKLTVRAVGKDAAFGYIPYVTADANQWDNPWWGGYQPKYAVNGMRPKYEGGFSHMIESLGEHVFGTKDALETANNRVTWRTMPYPVYPGNPKLEDIVFVADLGKAFRADACPRSPLVVADAPCVAHHVDEIRIWNCTAVSWLVSEEFYTHITPPNQPPPGKPECATAMRHVRFEYSGDLEAENWEDVTDWRRWGPEVYELAQPKPNIDSPPTDILDVSDIREPIRWWKITTLSDPKKSIAPNYGRRDCVGLGQIRFYTSKAHVAVDSAEHDCGNLKPYETASSPGVVLSNEGPGNLAVESVGWRGKAGPFTIASRPKAPAVLRGGEKLAPVVTVPLRLSSGTFANTTSGRLRSATRGHSTSP